MSVSMGGRLGWVVNDDGFVFCCFFYFCRSLFLCKQLLEFLNIPYGNFSFFFVTLMDVKNYLIVVPIHLYVKSQSIYFFI